jgi:hypothetical protein
MRQRGVVSDNEWNGRLRWMNSAFERGTIAEIWKTIEVGKWFDPAFLQVDLCLHLHRNQAPAAGSSYLSSISLSTLCFCISSIDPGESG